MNTKTMRLPPRRILTTDKRKERDGIPAAGKPPAKICRPQSSSLKTAAAASEPVASNQLLAGYLAHEFLTKGTLLGESWDPVRARAVPVSASVEPRKNKLSHGAQMADPSEREADPKRLRYMEVAHLLRADGIHLPGILNPTQLAGFLKQ